MQKKTLQKLTLALIAGAGAVFTGFAVQQLRIDAEAQGIVRHNSKLASEFREKTKSIADELLAVEVDYLFPMSSEKKQFLRRMQLRAKKLAQVIANTELQRGINIPSNNNKEIMSQRLADLAKSNLSLAEISYLHICLDQQVIKLNDLQKKLDQLLHDYTLVNTYTDSEQTLISIDGSYANILENLDLVIACFGKHLQTSALYSGLRQVIDRERSIVANYRRQYLAPLLQLYRQNDYLGAIEFQKQNSKAGQISLVYLSLFRAQKHNLDIFRARYLSYVEAEVRNLLLEVVTN